MAAVAAPSVREALQDNAGTDGAAAAHKASRARQQGHPRMAMHVGSNAAAPDYSVRRLGASELEHPPRLGWTPSWSTGFFGRYPNRFFVCDIVYIPNVLR